MITHYMELQQGSPEWQATRIGIITASRGYTAKAGYAVNLDGTDTPVAGFYRGKFRSNGALCGLRVWYGAPADPVTGEIMDRSHRWQIEVGGIVAQDIDVEARFWRLCRERITENAYQKLCAQAAWARDNAPQSSLADPRRKSNPLTSPLYF